MIDLDALVFSRFFIDFSTCFFIFPSHLIMSTTEFDRIYLNRSRLSGRVRLAESGLGWKAQQTQQSASGAKSAPFLLPSEEIISTSWSRGSRGYEVHIETKSLGVISLDGFDEQDFNRLKNTIRDNFNLNLDVKEHALRGWNWGKTNMTRSELVFTVGGKPAFEVPYDNINNVNLSGKNEVAVELDLDKESKEDIAGDELVEIKFYLPNPQPVKEEIKKESKGEEDAVKTEGNGEDEDVEMDDAEDEDKPEEVVVTAAETFVDNLKSRASLTEQAGPVIVSLAEVLLLTPRGRYDLDFSQDSLRLRGKTYDYKLLYKSIQRIFSLPKMDGINQLVILQVDPPLRQGQTKYNFLTLQFDAQEELEVELNIDDDEYEANYKNKLNKSYSASSHLVLANILRGFTERRVVLPGTYLSNQGLVGLACSLKANEGQIYPLEKCLLFVTKPTLLITYSEIKLITFSRVGAGSAQRTFDMEIEIKSGIKHNFGNLDKQEQPLLESYFVQKGLNVVNDEKVAKQMLVAAMGGDDDDGDADMGSADDDESPDEDFASGGSDSEVDEEFDSDAEGSDAGSGEDGPDKKKQKTDD